MPYKIAGTDVHKKMLAVVVATSRAKATSSLNATRSPLPEGQPADATRPESGRERRREGQGHHLRDRLSPACPTARARASHRRHHPPALSSDLEDSSPGHTVRGTRPAVSHQAKKVRALKMIRQLRTLGYRVELLPAPTSGPA
jgi:hypothetical protein